MTAAGRPGRPAKYTAEFKANAIDYYLQSGRSQAECASDLGIPRRSLGRWIQERRESHPDGAGPDEVRELRKEVERLRLENEFLKKAAAFFAAAQA